MSAIERLLVPGSLTYSHVIARIAPDDRGLFGTSRTGRYSRNSLPPRRTLDESAKISDRVAGTNPSFYSYRILTAPAYCALGGLGGVRSERRGMAGNLRTPLVFQSRSHTSLLARRQTLTRSRAQSALRPDPCLLVSSVSE
jgi:hypothetical protein